LSFCQGNQTRKTPSTTAGRARRGRKDPHHPPRNLPAKRITSLFPRCFPSISMAPRGLYVTTREPDPRPTSRTRFSRSPPTDLETRKGYNIYLAGYVMEVNANC
ncbi:hypothetical protein Taro_028267, partial [Colocasia esculenta]|nr:hypothetical protein [Colocasia esculenta]